MLQTGPVGKSSVEPGSASRPSHAQWAAENGGLLLHSKTAVQNTSHVPRSMNSHGQLYISKQATSASRLCGTTLSSLRVTGWGNRSYSTPATQLHSATFQVSVRKKYLAGQLSGNGVLLSKEVTGSCYRRWSSRKRKMDNDLASYRGNSRSDYLELLLGP